MTWGHRLLAVSNRQSALNTRPPDKPSAILFEKHYKVKNQAGISL